MKILQRRLGPAAVVCPQGPVVAADAEQLAAVLGQLLLEAPATVVVDAAAVPFADSRGLEVLMEAAEGLIRAGKVLRVANANETLREVIRLTGLAPLFEFHSTAEQAAGAVA